MTDLPVSGPAPRPGSSAAVPAAARFAKMKKELTMLAVLIGLAIITALLNAVFLNPDNLRNTIRHISLISLFALGEAVVIIAGGIDLSVGSVICLSAVTTSYLTMFTGVGIVGAAAIAICLSLVIGLLQGLVITWLGVQPFVVTLGSMLFLRGIAEVLTGGTDIGFHGEYPGFRFLGEGIGFGMPMPFWFALVAIAITAFLMHRTISTWRICPARRRRSARRTSCTRSRRPCSAAARCWAVAARCSASSSAPASCRSRSTP